MPDHVSRFTVALYDQNEDEPTADWGGDELFTRMPRRPKLDTAPAPRFRPSLALVDPPAERRRFVREEDPRQEDPREDAPATEDRGAPSPGHAARPAAQAQSGEAPGLALVRQWDGSPAVEPRDRPIRVITGRPDGVAGADGAPRPARIHADRRRPARTPADWIWARPERIVAWAFALGLILILVAISTADAATL